MDLISGYPFWPIADGLIQAYPRLTADVSCRVAVLGGGITGALVAHHLVEAGIETIVLDKRDVGTGSTAASTALLQYEIDTAHRVVFATGYETHAFLGPKVARLISTFALASEPLASFDGWGEDRCVIWEHARPYLYLRTTADARIILGGEDEDFRDPARPDRLIPRKTRRLAAQLGYGGNGITFSLLAAEIIRDALLGRRNEHAISFASIVRIGIRAGRFMPAPAQAADRSS